MAASSTYPVQGPPIVRGDPLNIPIDIKVQGISQDASAMAWRAQVRRSPDASYITEFAIDAITPPGETVPCRLVLNLTPDQTRILRSGMVFDLEQITDHATPVTIRTWWIVSKISVIKDVSRTAGASAAAIP